MIRTLIPIFAILVAIALFLTYIQPTFGEIGEVQEEAFQYKDAIDKAEQLRLLVQELTAERNNIPLADLERLEGLLPDSIDEISLLIDLDALATVHSMSLGSIQIQSEGDGDGGVGDIHDRFNETVSDENVSLDTPYRSLDISFTISGTYEEFRAFLADLERSLVLNEVINLQFGDSEEESDTQVYGMTIRFYALNQSI